MLRRSVRAFTFCAVDCKYEYYEHSSHWKTDSFTFTSTKQKLFTAIKSDSINECHQNLVYYLSRQQTGEHSIALTYFM